LLRCCCFCADRCEIRRRFAHSRRFRKPTTAATSLREPPSVYEKVWGLCKLKIRSQIKKKINLCIWNKTVFCKPNTRSVRNCCILGGHAAKRLSFVSSVEASFVSCDFKGDSWLDTRDTTGDYTGHGLMSPGGRVEKLLKRYYKCHRYCRDWNSSRMAVRIIVSCCYWSWKLKNPKYLLCNPHLRVVVSTSHDHDRRLCPFEILTDLSL